MTFEIKSPEKNWSPQQIEIFKNFAEGTGHTILDARAGCGKTTTVLEGLNYVPTSVRSILCVAFNKVIAEELKTRIKNPRAEAKTLHSLGNGFVFKRWGKVQIDERRSHKLALQASGLRNPPNGLIPAIAKLTSLGKNLAPFATVSDLIQIGADFDIGADLAAISWGQTEDPWELEDAATCAHRVMELSTQKTGSIDYDDMVFLPVRCKWIFPKYDMVVVDECQDMNAAQIILARGVCHRGGRIVVVGDPHQAIYGFRGADSHSMERLESELSAKRLGLTTTYRCPKAVVAIAQTIVPDFKAAPSAPEGIVRSLDSQELANAAQPGDFILSRKNAPLASTCLSLLRQGKRAVIRGRDFGATLVKIVEKQEAKDLFDLQEKINTWQQNTVEVLLRQDAPEAKIDLVSDQAETIKNLSEGLATIPELLSRMDALFSNNNIGSAIICSSVHKAKGLEADRVFLLVDTLYPGKNGRDSEEERNIHYVAVTRAKKELVLVKSSKN